MELEEAFTAYLKAQSNLIALISTRLYPEELPQNTTLPAVSYIKISDIKDHMLSGQSTLESPMFQFTAFALTKATARSVGNQIKTALQDYVGTMGGIVIQHIRLENELSNLETSPDGTIKTYTESLEFQINFIRS
jgi:hypothetical protein